MFDNVGSNNRGHNADSMSILIVDDEPDVLSVIRRRLEEYGFNTCSFTKPILALEHYKASSNNHRVVISDLRMPKMNGFEFIRKVKEINIHTKIFLMSCLDTDDLELLLFSSSPTQRLPSQHTKLMIDEFIEKPFSIEKLILLLNKHLNETKESITVT